MISQRKLAFLRGRARAGAPSWILQGFPMGTREPARFLSTSSPQERETPAARADDGFGAFAVVGADPRGGAFRGGAGAALRGRGRLPQDYPTERSLHQRPVSRVGGIAIWTGFLPVALLSPVAGGGRPRVAGRVGGRRRRVVRGRLVGRAPGGSSRVPCAGGADGCRVAAVARRRGRVLAAAYPRALGAALAIVWSANLFNFMDGNDGLAALMSICGFGAYGVAALAPA